MSIEAPIRILQVSTRDHGGGAERVAYDLFERYRALGHRSRLAVGYRRGDDPDVRAIAHHESRRGWRRFWWRAHARWQSI